MGNARNIAFWLVLFLLILALFNLFSGSSGAVQSKSVSYSEFITSVDNENVTAVPSTGR